jgi:hypothetical protein
MFYAMCNKIVKSIQAGSIEGIINNIIKGTASSSLISTNMKFACNYSLLGAIHIGEKAKIYNELVKK